MAQIRRLPGARDEIVLVNNTRYLAPYQESDPIIEGLEELGLATVIAIPGDRPSILTREGLQSIIESYTAHDDVFDEVFLAGLVISGAKEGEIDVSPDAHDYLANRGNKWVKFYAAGNLAPGPYMHVGGRLRDVWLLKDDMSGTLMTSLRPQYTGLDIFETFHIKSVDDHFISIPLRSRLKARHSSSSPISGWRVFVKDNVDLKGVKTSLGNRAYYDLYPPRSSTAESVQRVLDQGVVISGKTKLNSFGNWEEPLEYIDYQAPWNPRGDGYQSTGGSSSGSAAAISSYDWLDIAIGTDTWGSVTRPAQWCGCFGFRPSIGAVSTHGIEPYAPTWDVPGILGKDLKKLTIFATEWLLPDGLVKGPRPYTTIIWASDFWSIIDTDQVKHAKDFVKKTEKCLGVPTAEVSFAELWAQQPPEEAAGNSLAAFINEAPSCQGYDAYHNEDDFRGRYQAEYGRYPYVGPRIQQSWASAEHMTKAQRDDGYARIAVYKRWFEDTILTKYGPDALIVIPQENMTPRYRDETPSFRRPPQDGIGAMALAAVLNAPALTVPIGHVPYESRISRNEEYLPLTVTLISQQGTDLFLLDTVQYILEATNHTITVKTGRTMFDVS
ncbi:Glutamyl-tRNA amidotransferase [Pyrenophora tritici-repentis]|nr:Glutamyl-tRNA amidotransferase [Pyrenophora tritici-repentis]